MLRQVDKNLNEIKKWYPYIAMLLNEFHFTDKFLDKRSFDKLYRGVHLPEAVVDYDYSRIGTIFSWPSFASATKTPEIAKKFANNGRIPENY